RCWVRRRAGGRLSCFFQAEDGIRDCHVTGVQTCALPISLVHDKEDYSIIESLKLTDENAQDKMMREQIYKEVRLLVEELPFEQKEVVILRHFADMSFKEIADATGVSINTALGRMRYALINLRKIIETKKLVLVS